jgi:cellulose synthase operon protein C
VIQANPRNTQLWSRLAQIRLARQNWAGVFAVADALGRLPDDNGQADQIRAAAFAGQNKMDDSIAALERAHKAAPDAVQPVVSLVSALVRQGKSDKADSLLRDMTKKFPDNTQLLVLIGQTRLAQNKPSEAQQSFKIAIAKQPKDPAGYNALSEFYARQKNFDAAIDALQTGLRELPGDLNFRMSLAGLLILKGDQTGAIAQYESILKDQPNSLLAINNLVSLILDTQSDQKSLNRALSLAERLRNSDVPQFEDTWGWAQYKKGDYKSAVSILETVQSKLSNLAAVRYHLGMSYAATGQTAKAAEQLNAALALEPDGTLLKENIRSALKS